MKIAFFDAKEYDKIYFDKENNKRHEITYFKENLTIENVHLAIGFDAVCGFVNTSANKFILKLLSDFNVKYWFQRSMGYNKIDLAYAQKCGIKVFRVPNYSAQSVAEFAVTTLMTLNRKIPTAISRVKKFNFSLDKLDGKAIYNSCVGVLGAGKIGQEFIKIMKGMRAKIVVYDEFMEKNSPELALKLGFEYVSFTTMLKNSDFISLHAPLLASTKYIFDKHAYEYMKKGVIIVNTARGELMKLDDTISALESGKIAGLALDVMEREEGRFYEDISHQAKEIKRADKEWDRLISMENVIITSHQAFLTDVALAEIARITLQNADDAQNKNYDNALILMEDGKVKNG